MGNRYWSFAEDHRLRDFLTRHASDITALCLYWKENGKYVIAVEAERVTQRRPALIGFEGREVADRFDSDMIELIEHLLYETGLPLRKHEVGKIEKLVKGESLTFRG